MQGLQIQDKRLSHFPAGEIINQVEKITLYIFTIQIGYPVQRDLEKSVVCLNTKKCV